LESWNLFLGLLNVYKLRFWDPEQNVCTLYSLYDLVSAAVQWFDAVYNADIEYIKKHPKNINKVGKNTSFVFLKDLLIK
jgi:hypothetical protein